jgi:carbamate kinase
MQINEEGNAKLAVVALGGNAIIAKGEKGHFSQQFANTRRSMGPVIDLMKLGYNFIMTHGNGPQVGNIMLMVDCAKDLVPETPLGIADAMTCGSMGYMIEQCLQNVMTSKGVSRNVVTIPAQILIDPEDPAMKNPTKPIGPFYSQEDAEKVAKEKGWIMKEDAGRGWRRYVASPYPIDIVEKDAIKLLLQNGYIVVTGGGGGIPVSLDAKGKLEGQDCVIDKDFASMKIALTVGARILIIITGVKHVSINFGKPDQKDFTRMTVAEASRYYEEGHFPQGSMGPKILAAIEFVRANPLNRCVITDVDSLIPAMEGKVGTTIVAS